MQPFEAGNSGQADDLPLLHFRVEPFHQLSEFIRKRMTAKKFIDGISTAIGGKMGLCGRLSCISFGVVLCVQSVFAFRTWEDTQGRHIRAEFLSQDEETVTVRRYENLQRVTFAKELLSSADLEFLRDVDRQTRAERIRGSLLAKLPSTQAEIKTAFAQNGGKPGYIFWRNQMDPTDFWLWVSEVVEDETFDVRFQGRAIFGVLEDVTQFSLPFRDYHRNIASCVNILRCEEDRSNRSWGMKISNFSCEVYGRDTTIDNLERWLAHFEDQKDTAAHFFPNRWRSTPETQPDTLFAIATRVADSSERKPFFIVYAHGMERSAFESLKLSVAPLLEAEFGEDYYFGFIHQDPEFEKRYRFSIWEAFEGKPILVEFDTVYQRTLKRLLLGRAQTVTPENLVEAIKEVLDARREHRRNAKPADPF